MKVLKTADTSKWSYKFKCPQCDSELEAERGDVQHDHYDGDIREAPYDTWTVSCPICNRVHNILEKDIPKALQVQIRNKKFVFPGVTFADQYLDEKNKTPQSRE